VAPLRTKLIWLHRYDKAVQAVLRWSVQRVVLVIE